MPLMKGAEAEQRGVLPQVHHQPVHQPRLLAPARHLRHQRGRLLRRLHPPQRHRHQVL